MSLLKSFKKRIEKTSKFTIIKNQKYWKIDKIINNKTHYNKLKYLIKWKNCSNKNDEYLFVQNFKRAKNLIQNFITEYSNKFNQKIQKMLNANINFEKSNLKNNFQFIIKFEKQLKFRKKKLLKN